MSELIKEEKEPFTEQIAEIEEGARKGNMNCQTAFGKCLLFGWGVDKSEAQAYEWFEKAAGQGDEIAKMYMGHCQLYGIDTETNERVGYEMLDAALNYNYPGAGSSQSQSERSSFSNDDLCQLFLDGAASTFIPPYYA